MTWYHGEATERDGTTWRTTQPLPSLDAVCEWLRSHPDAVLFKVERFED